MEEIAIYIFPYFNSEELLMLVVGLAFMRLNVFHCKDLNNLVKFVIGECYEIFICKQQRGRPSSGRKEHTGWFGGSIDKS
jgi:hypothetical protein